jgi:hypothetical protein
MVRVNWDFPYPKKCLDINNFFSRIRNKELKGIDRDT